MAGTYDADAFDQRVRRPAERRVRSRPLKYTRDALDAGGKRLGDSGADDLSVDGAAAESVGRHYDHLTAAHSQFAIVPANIAKPAAQRPAGRPSPSKLADDVDAGDPLVKAVADDLSAGGSASRSTPGSRTACQLVVASKPVQRQRGRAGGGPAGDRRADHLQHDDGLDRRAAAGDPHLHVARPGPLHVGALFVAEAMTYGLIGSRLRLRHRPGRRHALLEARLARQRDPQLLRHQRHADHGLVLVVVFLSALVPARTGQPDRRPSIERSWRVPLAGRRRRSRPSSRSPSTARAAEGVLAYLADFFDAHREGSIGKFSAADVEATSPPGDPTASPCRTTSLAHPLRPGRPPTAHAPRPPRRCSPTSTRSRSAWPALSGDDGNWYRMNARS